MTDSKPQPDATTTTGPPVPGEIEKLCAAGLAYWEARLVVKARQVRAEQLRYGENRASMFITRFDGAAMTLWRGSPFTGQRVEMSASLVRGRYLEIWALASDGMVSE